MSNVVILLVAEAVLIIVIISVIFWFFFRRPHSKQERLIARREFIPLDTTGTQQERPPVAGRLAVAWLVVADGETKGAHHPVEEGTTLIGRGSSCDVILLDPGVSRQHARIIRQGDDSYLYDLDSTNGTFVNGEVVGSSQPTPLKDGNIVSIGDTSLMFKELRGKELM